MSVNLTGSRVQLDAVYDSAVDTSVVKQNRPDRDAGTLLSLRNDQPWANIRPIHHGVEQVGVMAQRCPRCGWAWWMRCPHAEVLELTPAWALMEFY